MGGIMDGISSALGGIPSDNSRPVNNPGNIRPVGSSTGFQQYDSPSDGVTAIDNNLKAYQKKGVTTLGGIISRWSPPSENNTPALIANAAKFTGLDPSQPLDVTNNTAHLELVRNAILRQEGNGGSSQAQPSADSIMGGIGAALEMPTVNPTPKQINKPSAAKSPIAQQADAMLGGTAPLCGQDDKSSLLYKGFASAADTALGIVPFAANLATYAGSRALGNSPEQADQTAAKLSSFLDRPIGKALGITGDAAYKNEASRQILGFIGNNIHNGSQWVADKLGMPIQDVEHIVNALTAAAPGAVKDGVGAVKTAAGTIRSQFAKLNEYRNGPLPAQYSTDGATPAANDAAGIHSGAAQVQPPLDQGGRAQPAAGQPRQIVGAGSAAANANIYPVLTGEETARGPFPVVKLSKISTDVSLPEQQARSQIAGQILGDINRVRTGVITGNENALRNEYTEAKSPNPTPKGELLKQQIADEQNALSDYSQERVEATGALPTLSNDYQRGEFVNSVFAGEDGLTGHLKALKQEIYDQAKQTVGDNPVDTSHLDRLLQNKQFNAELKLNGQKDFTGGLGELVNVMKTSGFKDAPPNSVAAMEALRKSLNAQWTPANKHYIGQAIQAIDDDVAQAGGAGLYEQGRAIHKAEKTLYASKGIKTLFGDIDPNGVQTATPFDAIPKKLNDMPFDQWRHVYETADALSKGRIPGAPNNMPPPPKELQQAAAQAKNEIAGMLARKIHEAGAKNIGTWNQNAANAAMNSLYMKIERAMPPEEQTAFHTLNYGGQIMPGVHSYEGSGLQMKRMADAGLFERHAPAIGATIGELTHIPGAAWVGDKIGQKASATAQMKRMFKEAKETDARMEANSKLGKK